MIITKSDGDTNYEYYISATDKGKSGKVVIPVKDFVKQNTKITVDDLKNVSRIALAGDAPKEGSVTFGKTFTITTSSSAMAMSMKGFIHSGNGSQATWEASNLKLSWNTATNNYLNLWDFTNNNNNDLSEFAGGSFIYQAKEVSGSAKKHRLIIRCVVNNVDKDFVYKSEIVGDEYQTISLNDFKFTKDNKSTPISASDLENVKTIMILGDDLGDYKNGALILGETFTLVAEYQKFTLNVDNNERKYWLYVPPSAVNNKNVPVIFSLHGRQGNGADPSNTDAPRLKSVADTHGVIIVLPEGQKKYINNNAYGWEATGEENADTKFIQALVDELKKNKFYGSTTVDPKRFYLCGFSMGGMMTYACAKVLNGTFAAYGSCGGYPLNEFHLNLATKQPVPFIHLHGDNDGVVGIKHLHTIIENLLFRNGCSLAGFKETTEWTTTTTNGEEHHFKRYDFTGENGVPVTTVTFNGLWHSVESSAPNYLWNFFKDKKLGTYTTTTMKWQWDMTTINSNLGDSNGYPYGWKRVAISGNNTMGTLTYGDNRKTQCTTPDCSSASANCNGNHNVYNSIQLEKGTYKLHAEATVAKSDNTGIIVGIYKVEATENTGKCIVRRQVKNNSGDDFANLSILYPFTVTEDGEYYVKIERGNESTSCTALAIHTSDYNPEVEDDSENAMKLPQDWEDNGLIVKIDFEGVGENCENIGEEPIQIQEGNDKNGKYNYLYFTETPPTEGYKLYSRHHGDNNLRLSKKGRTRQTLWGGRTDASPKLLLYDT